MNLGLLLVQNFVYGFTKFPFYLWILTLIISILVLKSTTTGVKSVVIVNNGRIELFYYTKRTISFAICFPSVFAKFVKFSSGLFCILPYSHYFVCVPINNST